MNSSLFDGMYISHNFTSGTTEPIQFSYIYDGGDIYNESWNGMIWQVSNRTRIMTGGSFFGDGNHTPAWIFTNMSTSPILISVIGEGDHTFNITGETKHSFPGIGVLEIWILQDNDHSDSILWYEKSTGILLNGTFIYSGGNYSFSFIGTNSNIIINYIMDVGYSYNWIDATVGINLSLEDDGYSNHTLLRYFSW